MKYAQKKEGKRVQAYELGCGSQMEDNLIREGVIRHLENGDYELFSREAVNGKGELAHPGDYFKVDTEGERHYPYPNNREFFLANHRHIREKTCISLYSIGGCRECIYFSTALLLIEILLFTSNNSNRFCYYTSYYSISVSCSCSFSSHSASS